MKFSSLFICFFLALSSLFAQDPADIYYRTIPMDSIDQVTISTFANDKVEMKVWPGNHLMIETSVMLYNGRQNILDFFKEKGRWDFESQVNGKQLSLTPKDNERRSASGEKGAMEDDVTIVIYVPEDFSSSNQTTWVRKDM
jgi:hypothetical protein